MNITDIFKTAVKRFPDNIGIVDGNHSLTYIEIDRLIQSLAYFLHAEGVKPGDRISILDYNSRQFYEAYFAASHLGAVLNPLNYRLSANELDYIIKDAGSQWLITDLEFSETVEKLLQAENDLRGIIYKGNESPEFRNRNHAFYDDIVQDRREISPAPLEPEDYAHLYYTSGTTGKPKGVILTHRNVCRHALGAISELNLAENDRWGHIAPMFHLADAWAVFAMTMVGGTHVIQLKFDAGDTLQLIERERITISNLIPTMLNLMVKHPRIAEFDLSSLRVILSGGAPIAPEVVRKIMELFKCDYIQTYGMTETSPYLTLSILHEHLQQLPLEEQFKYKTKTGRGFTTVDLQVVRKDGTPIAADDKEVGEIWVKGETITPGYWKSPAETDEAFTDGWLKTGDLATIDNEGYVNIVDRLKDMILCGGENIYSIEVENVLYQHSAVLEAAVIGLPDEIWGEIVAGAVVLKPGEEKCECELIEFCRQRLSGFKTPKKIIFLDSLPKTGSGKINKKELRRRLLGG